MSRTADIDFTFQGPVKPSVFVQALSRSGWSSVEPLGVSCAVEDEDGDLEWERAAPESVEQILVDLDSRQESGQLVGISLYNQEADTGGLLLFFRDRTQVSFTPRINRRSLAVAEEMTDLSWYLGSMVPELYGIGLMGYEAQDIAD
ncbi:hypothetical protein ACFY2W_33175 [Streptomyces sp. NPDC001262]|uniref:hypothetical protein n=1 Tax=unclassified Streptomyces TaxID=2593676 RepID=UPI0036CE35AB